MRKILFVLFAALAFVACDKEEDKPNWNFPKFSPSAALSCLDNSGMTIVLKSEIPAEFLSTMLVLSYQENPGYEEYLYDTSTGFQLGHVMDCAEDGTPYLEIKDYEKDCKNSDLGAVIRIVAFIVHRFICWMQFVFLFTVLKCQLTRLQQFPPQIIRHYL